MRLYNIACPSDYKLSALIDDLSSFFQQFITVREELAKKRAIEEELQRAKRANEQMRAQMQEQKRQQLLSTEGDLMNDYKTMRKNQMKQFHSTKEVPMLGTLKSKLVIPHRGEDPLTPKTIRRSIQLNPNSPRLGYNTKDPFLFTTNTLFTTSPKHFSFTLSSDDDDKGRSMEQITSPLHDHTLTLTSKERKSLFTPSTPPRANKQRTRNVF